MIIEADMYILLYKKKKKAYTIWRVDFNQKYTKVTFQEMTFVGVDRPSHLAI